MRELPEPKITPVLLEDFKRVLAGGRGDLDAWLEVNNEAEVRAFVLAIQKQAYEDGLRDAGKDAERYQWLRTETRITSHNAAWIASVTAVKDGPCDIFSADEVPTLLDAEIDRRMAAMLAASQKPRCELCNYQHGHAIGCANNPVDIALKAASQKGQQ